MLNEHPHSTSILNPRLRMLRFALTLVCALTAMEAQTYIVLHTFTGGADGAAPAGLLTIDAAGNFYGTTYAGGNSQCVNHTIINPCGTVFKLAHRGSGWTFAALYEFTGTDGDGAGPAHNSVVFGPDGALYGAATYGGSGAGKSGNGTVFRLTPPPTFCGSVSCPWTETILYRFLGGSDGSQPVGNVIFDHSGNLYGTTDEGGPGNCASGCGTVYKLIHSNSGWTESVAYAFPGSPNGANPGDGVIMDGVGNLYGTTSFGGSQSLYGEAFELLPSGSGWTENHLHDFRGGTDGANPEAALIFDSSGNLYGDTYFDGYLNGQGGAGSAFDLMPSGGEWSYGTLAAFNGTAGGPEGRLVMDSAGNLYGTTAYTGRYSYGEVFRLTPSNGGWTLTDLYDFTGGSDGGVPYNGLTMDSQGNLYGTTSQGGGCSLGLGGCGVIFEITP